MIAIPLEYKRKKVNVHGKILTYHYPKRKNMGNFLSTIISHLQRREEPPLEVPPNQMEVPPPHPVMEPSNPIDIPPYSHPFLTSNRCGDRAHTSSVVGCHIRHSPNRKVPPPIEEEELIPPFPLL
jgi:hypothetical protein